ncbi:MAG: WD40 repeat domain-containing protein [Gammaproteobacteria bacterium]|jgi:hypothetical protein|nr:WD40 repeat domain-containing protein [Gammaproteobacteria bacterium]MBT7372267.1 WD40 repeat domain-containing protein [Gammaproteobacteria bacterium]
MNNLMTIHKTMTNRAKNLIPILAACALAYTTPALASCTVELHGKGSDGNWRTISIKDRDDPLGMSDVFDGYVGFWTKFGRDARFYSQDWSGSDWNDEIEKIDFFGHCTTAQVTLYEHKDYGGWQKVITPQNNINGNSLPTGISEKASSVEVVFRDNIDSYKQRFPSVRGLSYRDVQANYVVREQSLQVALGANGTTFALDGMGSVRQWDGSKWRYVEQKGAQHWRFKGLAIHPNGLPWVVAQNNIVYRWDTAQSTWVNFDYEHKTISGAIKDIAIGADGSVFGIAMDDTVMRWEGTWWKNLEPVNAVKWKFKKLTVDKHGRPWVVAQDNLVYRWDPAQSTWVNFDYGHTTINGASKDLAAGADGTIFAISMSDNVRRWDGTYWQWVENGVHWEFKHISADAHGRPTGVGKNDMIYRWDVNAPGWLPLEPKDFWK